MKYLKNKEKTKLPGLLVAAGIVVIIGLVAWILAGCPGIPGGNSDRPHSITDPSDTAPTGDPNQSDESAEHTQPTETTAPAISMPYALEHGKLTLVSLFQFTGMNPDAQDEYVENVAALQVTNTSQQHLQSASITVTTKDGTDLSFVARDIPAGRSAIVVCPDNTVIGDDVQCDRIAADVVFSEQTPIASDKLAISVLGTEITVENISGDDLTQITVYCHSVLDQSFYGGETYAYTIDSLPAGETAVISAWECYLGIVEVVRVGIGTE